MKLIRFQNMLLLGLSLAVAAPALATPPPAPAKGTKAKPPHKRKVLPPSATNPKGWVPVKTGAFDMYLPKDFMLIGEVHENPKTPWLGRWRFGTEGGRSKIFVRVEPLQKLSLKKIMKASIEQLRKRASDIQPQGDSEASDEQRRPLLISFFQATMNAKNSKTKKMEPRPHLVVTLVQQFPAVNTQVRVTYLFTRSWFEAGRVFVAEHSRRLQLHDTKAALDKIRALGAKFPRASAFVKAHPGRALLEKKVKFQIPGAVQAATDVKAKAGAK